MLSCPQRSAPLSALLWDSLSPRPGPHKCKACLLSKALITGHPTKKVSPTYPEWDVSSLPGLGQAVPFPLAAEQPSGPAGVG